MRRASELLVLACLMAAGAATEGVQDESAQRVAALSRDLETPNPGIVYRSLSRMTALGLPALPEIEARAKAAQGRLHDYLELAAEEIRSSPAAPALPPLRRVTMKSTDRNVIELLSELRTKTGAPISLDSLLDEEKLPEVPVDIRDATMLEAFDAICHAGNVSIAMADGQFQLSPGQYLDVPRFFYGPYLFRLQEFELIKSVDFRKPATHDFKLTMEAVWDPASAPTRFRPPCLLEAVDDKGKNLLPRTAPARKKDGDPEAEEEDTTTLLFVPPSAGAEKISVLRGYIPIEVPKTRETAVFGTPTKDQTKKVGRFTFNISKLNEDPFHVEGELTPLADLKALGTPIFLATVVLQGGDQTRVVVAPTWKPESLGLVVSFQPLRIREVLVKPNADPATPPVIERMEISIVTSVLERRIPFEFRDVKIK
jgi:hypothetical protein